MKIDLPEPFEDLDIDNRVVGGEITIPQFVDSYLFLAILGQLLTVFSEAMASFFEPSATRIVGLIDDQRKQIEDISDLRTRLKA